MPKVIVDGKVKHFPYTKEGHDKAMKAKKRMMSSDGYMKK